MKNILCFGDSNTHGSNPDGLIRYNKNERWTGILQNILGYNEYYVIEEGLGGRTTIFNDDIIKYSSGIEYVSGCLMSHKPIDLMIIMLGTNDTKECFNANAYRIGMGLSNLIKEVKLFDMAFRYNNPNILIICPPPILPQIYENSFGEIMGSGCCEKSNELHNHFMKIAKEFDCYYINAGEFVSPSDVDCVHLSAKSHNILANVIYNKINSIFNN